MRSSLCLRLLVASRVLVTPALGHAQEPAPARSGAIFRAAPDAPAPVQPAPPMPAAPPRIPPRRLDFTRGPGTQACPDQDALRAAVAANVGYDPFEPAATPRVIASITREGETYVARMAADGASGKPPWSHPPISDVDCRNLVRTMGLSIAIAIDPFPSAPAGAPSVVVVSQPPPPSRPIGQDQPPAVPATSERPKVRAGLAAAVALGMVPGPSAALSAQAGVRWPLFSIAAEGRVDLPAGVDAQQGIQVRSMLVAGSLVPCGHIPLPLDRWNVAACGVVTVGALRAARGDVAVSGAGLYAGMGARASLEIPVGGPVALRLSAELLGSIKPATIQIQDQTVMTTGPVTAGLGGGVVADF